MNYEFNDKITQSLSNAVKQVQEDTIAKNKINTFVEGRMKELHALIQKGKSVDYIIKDMKLKPTPEMKKFIGDLIKKEASIPYGKVGLKEYEGGPGKTTKAERDFIALHLNNLEIFDNPEDEKPEVKVESTSDDEEEAMDANKKDLEKSLPKQTKVEELSPKQKKLDLNKNGKIDGEDLANLRKSKKEDVASDEEEAMDANKKDLEKSLPKQTKVESYTEEFGDVILLDLSEGKEDMSSVKLQVSDPKKVHKQWHGITSIRVSMTKYDDEVIVKGKKKDLLRVLPKLGFDKNDIEDMYSHLLEGLTEALSKNDKTAGYAGRGQFDLKRHIMPLVNKNKSLKDIYFDGPDLVGDTKKGKQTTLAKGVLTNKKMTVGDLEKVVTSFKESTYTEELLNDILEKKNSKLNENPELDKIEKELEVLYNKEDELGKKLDASTDDAEADKLQKELDSTADAISKLQDKMDKVDLDEYVGPALTPANQIAKKYGGKVKAIMVKDEKGKKTKMFYAEMFELDRKGSTATYGFLSKDDLSKFEKIAKKNGLKPNRLSKPEEKKVGSKKYFTMTYTGKVDNLIAANKEGNKVIRGIKEELEEAIQPGEFVKGGNKKVSKDDVDKILNRILFNDRLQSTMEKSKAFKEGQKSKGKKKNPYKEDTLDYHHFELGSMESQMG